MQSTTSFIYTTIFCLFLGAAFAQQPARRTSKMDTSNIRVKGKEVKLGKSEKASAEVLFDRAVEQANENSNSFDRRITSLKDAVSILENNKRLAEKNKWKTALTAAYGNVIEALLGEAIKENSFQDRVKMLEKARQLCDGPYAPQEKWSAIQSGFKKAYQYILDRARAKSTDIDRRTIYTKAAYTFCGNYADILGISDCDQIYQVEARQLIDQASRKGNYRSAYEVCAAIPVLDNCERFIDQNRVEVLLDKSRYQQDFNQKKSILKEALNIAEKKLGPEWTEKVGGAMSAFYTNAFRSLLMKARGNAVAFEDRMDYINQAASYCGIRFAPVSCDAELKTARQEAYEKAYENNLLKIKRTDDYKKQIQWVEESEQLVNEGQLPQQKRQEINSLKKKIHYQQIQRLVNGENRAFNDQIENISAAEEINRQYLNGQYQYLINQRRNDLVTSEVNKLLYNSRGDFQDRLRRIDNALQLANYTSGRSNTTLTNKVRTERYNLLKHQYNFLYRKASTALYFDDKIAGFNQALGFCQEYGQFLDRNSCDLLVQERQRVVVEEYRGLLDVVNQSTQEQKIEYARVKLQEANDLYRNYSTELSREMPITTAYQRLYNHLIKRAGQLRVDEHFSASRSVVQQAQELEQEHNWIIPGNPGTVELMRQIDRAEFDFLLQKVEGATSRSVGRVAMDQLPYWQSAYELYAGHPEHFDESYLQRLKAAFQPIVEAGKSNIEVAIETNEWNAAENILVQFKQLLNINDSHSLMGQLKGETQKLLESFYRKKLITINQNISKVADLSDLRRQLNLLKNKIIGERLLEKNRQDELLRENYTKIYNQYAQRAFDQLRAGSLEIEEEKQDLRIFWENQSEYIGNQLHKSTMGSLAFLENYKKARFYLSGTQFEKAVAYFSEAAKYSDFAPAPSGAKSYADSLNRYSKIATQMYLTQSTERIRTSTSEEQRIDDFRGIQNFITQNQLILSSQQAEALQTLKNEVFEAICNRNTATFYDQLKKAEAALQRDNYREAVRAYQAAVEIALETLECQLVFERAESQIKRYQAAANFLSHSERLEALEKKALKSWQKADFDLYEREYKHIFSFYQDSVINRGFDLDMIPFQEKIMKLKDYRFYAFAIINNAYDVYQLDFVSGLLKTLIKSKKYSEEALMDLASALAEADRDTFGRVSFREPLERYKIDNERTKRYKKFRRAYRRAF